MLPLVSKLRAQPNPQRYRTLDGAYNIMRSRFRAQFINEAGAASRVMLTT